MKIRVPRIAFATVLFFGCVFQNVNAADQIVNFETVSETIGCRECVQMKGFTLTFATPNTYLAAGTQITIRMLNPQGQYVKLCRDIDIEISPTGGGSHWDRVGLGNIPNGGPGARSAFIDPTLRSTTRGIGVYFRVSGLAGSEELNIDITGNPGDAVVVGPFADSTLVLEFLNQRDNTYYDRDSIWIDDDGDGAYNAWGTSEDNSLWIQADISDVSDIVCEIEAENESSGVSAYDFQPSQAQIATLSEDCRTVPDSVQVAVSTAAESIGCRDCAQLDGFSLTFDPLSLLETGDAISVRFVNPAGQSVVLCRDIDLEISPGGSGGKWNRPALDNIPDGASGGSGPLVDPNLDSNAFGSGVYLRVRGEAGADECIVEVAGDPGDALVAGSSDDSSLVFELLNGKTNADYDRAGVWTDPDGDGVYDTPATAEENSLWAKANYSDVAEILCEFDLQRANPANGAFVFDPSQPLTATLAEDCRTLPDPVQVAVSTAAESIGCRDCAQLDGFSLTFDPLSLLETGDAISVRFVNPAGQSVVLCRDIDLEISPGGSGGKWNRPGLDNIPDGASGGSGPLVDPNLDSNAFGSGVYLRVRGEAGADECIVEVAGDPGDALVAGSSDDSSLVFELLNGKTNADYDRAGVWTDPDGDGVYDTPATAEENSLWAKANYSDVAEILCEFDLQRANPANGAFVFDPSQPLTATLAENCRTVPDPVQVAVSTAAESVGCRDCAQLDGFSLTFDPLSLLETGDAISVRFVNPAGQSVVLCRDIDLEISPGGSGGKWNRPALDNIPDGASGGSGPLVDPNLDSNAFGSGVYFRVRGEAGAEECIVEVAGDPGDALVAGSFDDSSLLFELLNGRTNADYDRAGIWTDPDGDGVYDTPATAEENSLWAKANFSNVAEILCEFDLQRTNPANGSFVFDPSQPLTATLAEDCRTVSDAVEVEVSTAAESVGCRDCAQLDGFSLTFDKLSLFETGDAISVRFVNPAGQSVVLCRDIDLEISPGGSGGKWNRPGLDNIPDGASGGSGPLVDPNLDSNAFGSGVYFRVRGEAGAEECIVEVAGDPGDALVAGSSDDSSLLFELLNGKTNADYDRAGIWTDPDGDGVYDTPATAEENSLWAKANFSNVAEILCEFDLQRANPANGAFVFDPSQPLTATLAENCRTVPDPVQVAVSTAAESVGCRDCAQLDGFSLTFDPLSLLETGDAISVRFVNPAGQSVVLCRDIDLEISPGGSGGKWNRPGLDNVPDGASGGSGPLVDPNLDSNAFGSGVYFRVRGEAGAAECIVEVAGDPGDALVAGSSDDSSLVFELLNGKTNADYDRAGIWTDPDGDGVYDTPATAEENSLWAKANFSNVAEILCEFDLQRANPANGTFVFDPSQPLTATLAEDCRTLPDPVQVAVSTAAESIGCRDCAQLDGFSLTFDKLSLFETGDAISVRFVNPAGQSVVLCRDIDLEISPGGSGGKWNRPGLDNIPDGASGGSGPLVDPNLDSNAFGSGVYFRVRGEAGAAECIVEVAGDPDDALVAGSSDDSSLVFELLNGKTNADYDLAGIWTDPDGDGVYDTPAAAEENSLWAKANYSDVAEIHCEFDSQRANAANGPYAFDPSQPLTATLAEDCRTVPNESQVVVSTFSDVLLTQDSQQMGGFSFTFDPLSILEAGDTIVVRFDNPEGQYVVLSQDIDLEISPDGKGSRWNRPGLGNIPSGPSRSRNSLTSPLYDPTLTSDVFGSGVYFRVHGKKGSSEIFVDVMGDPGDALIAGSFDGSSLVLELLTGKGSIDYDVGGLWIDPDGDGIYDVPATAEANSLYAQVLYSDVGAVTCAVEWQRANSENGTPVVEFPNSEVGSIQEPVQPLQPVIPSVNEWGVFILIATIFASALWKMKKS